MALLDDIEVLIKGRYPHLQTVAECMAEIGAPSVSIAFLEDGKVSSRCYSTIGDDTETIFQACSISKPVSAMAVMRLVDQGRLAVDDTIGSLLPRDILDELTDGYPAVQAKIIEGITLKQLMSHTAGLTQHGYPGYPENPGPSARQVLAGGKTINTPRVRLTSLPGLAFSYSGGGITVLQLVLESVTGKDFPSLMRELVLDPLEMKRSFFGELPGGEHNAAKAHWNGLMPYEVPHFNFQATLAAAGLWTTPTDLIKVVVAVQQSLEGDAFLRQETAKEMLTVVKGGVMALGWGVPDGGFSFAHGGSNLPGFECFLAGFANLGNDKAPKNSGFAIMTNSVEGQTPVSKIAQAATYVKGWPVLGSAGAGTVLIPFPVRDALATETWKPWIGKWTDGTHDYSLGEVDGKPVFLFNESTALSMLPAAIPLTKEQEGDLVFVVEGLDLTVRLKTDGEERILVLGNGLSESELTFKQKTD